MEKATGFIYCIQNKVNLKQYVGQTINSLETRFKGHIRDSLNQHKNTGMSAAIRKYGKDNFIIFELETCEIKHLNDREAHWIYFLNTYYKGYNRKHRSNHDIQEINKIIKEFLKGATINNLSKKHKISKNTLSYHIKKKGIDTYLNSNIRYSNNNIKEYSTEVNIKNKLMEFIEEIVKLYKEGYTTRKLAEKFNCDKSTIISRLKEQNIELREPNQHTKVYKIKRDNPELIPKIIKLYNDGNNLKQIREIINIHQRHISFILKENNIKVKPGSRYT